jgi:hypothetical protein
MRSLAYTTDFPSPITALVGQWIISEYAVTQLPARGIPARGLLPAASVRFSSSHVSLGKRRKASGMADNKTKPTNLSVAAFIDKLADRTRRADAKTLVQLMQSAAGENPKMWGPSIIGFGSYHYRYDSGREGDMPVIAFSPRKAATVLYNMTGFSDSETLRAKLGKHTTGKGCLYIKKLADVDQQVLEALIVKSVAAVRARYPS